MKLEDRNTQVVRSLYEACLNQNRPDELVALLSEDVRHHGATEDRGLAAYRSLVDRLRAAFPDMHFTLLDLIASEDRVVVRWTMDATHAGLLAGIPATGRRVQQRGNVIYRLEGDKIVEIWSQMDQVGMLRQLGIDPLGTAKAGAAR